VERDVHLRSEARDRHIRVGSHLLRADSTATFTTRYVLARCPIGRSARLSTPGRGVLLSLSTPALSARNGGESTFRSLIGHDEISSRRRWVGRSAHEDEHARRGAGCAGLQGLTAGVRDLPQRARPDRMM
jgi:hypothetical protein